MNQEIRLTVHMYTLRKSMQTPEDLEETFRRVAEMGYKTVQISPPKFTNAIEVAAQLKRHGLQADSAMCGVYDIPDQIEQIARNAEALGTDMVRTNSIRKEDRLSAEGYHSFARHLNHCGKLLRGIGLDFMYHFHAFEWLRFGDKRGMDILLEETDPEYVMFQPDLFWLNGAGMEPSRALEMFKGRMRYIHCKDYTMVPPQDDVLERIARASAPVGTGNMHWKEIAEAALRLGVTNFVAEDDIGRVEPFESAEISLRNMKKIFLPENA